MKEAEFINTKNETDLHYDLIKKFFKKSAEDKKKFYNSKGKVGLEKEIKKRSMWRIYSLILDEILKKDDDISSVIDIACGMGNFTMELAKLNNLNRIVGIDFLKETFDIARKTENIFRNVSFIQGDLLRLPFNDQSFDFTVCLNTIHHIYKNDFYKAINELTRITKNYLMLEIRNKDYILMPWKNKIILQKVYRDLPIYCSSISDLNDLMKKNGFKQKIIRGSRSITWICWRLVLVYERD